MALPYNHSSEAKKTQVKKMFDAIASNYDFLNHFLSMGIDKYWRKKLVKRLKGTNCQSILDVAAGTGDLTLALARLKPAKLVGADLSSEMLRVGQLKVEKKGLANLIKLQQADAESLPFSDNSFDAVTAAFGVRNFENLLAGLREMNRVLRPGATLLILEFSTPKKSWFSGLFTFYFKFILPFIGRLVSRDSSAYTYLPLSVSEFPDREKFTAILQQAGFDSAQYTELTFGVVCLYQAKKSGVLKS